MTLKTHSYALVNHFRDTFGLHQSSMSLHRSLFDEETEEFYDAKTDEDVADALGDMIFIYVGCLIDTGKPLYRDEDWFWSYVQDQAQQVGIDLKGAVSLIYDSNMSKLCKTEELAPTIKKYNDIGVNVDFKQLEDELFAVYSDSNQTGTDGKFYPQGKLLKSVAYREPDWTRTDIWRL